MPRPTKETAIRRLQRQLDGVPELKRLRFDPPEFTEWGSDTKTAIINAFGETSRYVKDFEAIHYTPTVSIANGTLMAQYQEAYTRGLDKASARLRSMIRDVTRELGRSSGAIHS